jgi:hypothetical protein
VAAIFVGENLEAGAKLLAEALKDSEGAIYRSVIDCEENEIFGPILQRLNHS